jgi:glucan phosphoethanolaminetransferase (alkaline phosphatase superfamily)
MKKNGFLYVKFFLLFLFIGATVNIDFLSDRFSSMHDSAYWPAGAFIIIAIWILCIAALAITSVLPNYYLRIILTVLIIISTASDVIYQMISEHEINYDVLQILWENRNFAGDAFDFYRGEIHFVVVVIFIGATGLLMPCKIIRNKNKMKFFSSTILNIFAISPYIVLFVSIQAQGCFSGGLPFQYKTTSLLSILFVDNVLYGEIERTVSIPLKKSNFGPEKPNILLIVDESVRGDFIDINRNLGVTPHLYAQRERLTNFGYASSGGNCSLTSNQIIRVGANPDPEKFNASLRNNPYIWQYAKKAGYRTVMIDSQTQKGKMNNRLSKIEVSMLDEFKYVEGASAQERDIDAGRFIKTLLNNKQKKHPYFIIFVKKGIHFPYEERYPKEAAIFLPDRKKGEPLDDVEKLTNSYKNALFWVTDSTFADFFDNNAEFSDSIIIYTSDHGQSLLDKGAKLSHCSQKDVSPYEGLVPLFIITDNKKWKKIFDDAAMKNKNKASHFNIVPTVLDIFGYAVPERMERHGMSLLDGQLQEPRRFISNFITLNRPSPFSKKKNRWHALPETFKTAE